MPPRPAPPLCLSVASSWQRDFVASRLTHNTRSQNTTNYNYQLDHLDKKTIARYFTRHSRCWTRSQKTVKGTLDNNQTTTLARNSVNVALPLTKRTTNKSYTLTFTFRQKNKVKELHADDITMRLLSATSREVNKWTSQNGGTNSTRGQLHAVNFTRPARNPLPAIHCCSMHFRALLLYFK